jgi:hypothetical protein
MSFTAGSIAWRLPIACQIIFAFVWICAFIEQRSVTDSLRRLSSL